MMYRVLVPLCLAAACSAQEATDLFTRAPQALDDALRARMAEFYKAHVDGRYRQAEQLVAEDTKDFFYTANKPKYVAFEIRNIQYGDDFTTAKAIVMCSQYVMMPGFADKPVQVPTPSTWKLVDGKWYWYVDQSKGRATPWGTVHPGDGPTPSGGSAPAPLPAIPTEAEMGGLLHQVRADRDSVTLTGDKTEKVVLANGAPGSLRLAFFGVLPASLHASFDHEEIGAGAKVTLSIRRAGKHKAEGTIQVQVIPTNQIIPITVATAP